MKTGLDSLLQEMAETMNLEELGIHLNEPFLKRQAEEGLKNFLSFRDYPKNLYAMSHFTRTKINIIAKTQKQKKRQNKKNAQNVAKGSAKLHLVVI